MARLVEDGTTWNLSMAIIHSWHLNMEKTSSWFGLVVALKVLQTLHDKDVKYVHVFIFVFMESWAAWLRLLVWVHTMDK